MTGAYAKQPPTRQMKHNQHCAVTDCGRPFYAKTYCRKHWERNYRNGAPITVVLPADTPIPERLEFHSERRGECLEYTGHLDRYGYGQITINGKGQAVHRVAYEVAHGPIPEDMMVRHKCDNPPCIDSGHLELGTNQDNSDDKVSRGRSLFGSRNPDAKLVESQVAEILVALASGETQKHLASVYGVGQSTIGRIHRRENWKHVGGQQ
jgi:hypothetical protein